jgi:hypothetical protein
MAEVKKDEKKDRNGLYFGLKNAAALTIAAGTVAALVTFRSCKPEPEPPRECPPQVTCPAGPARGDGRCEMDKSEHDPASPSFDPASCGICGDGIRQQWETAENCAVDFHCGNGTVERNRVMGGYVAPEQSGGVYRLAEITVTESCNERDTNYCAEDCPNGPAVRERSDRQRGRGSDRPPQERPERRSEDTPTQCTGDVISALQRKINGDLRSSAAAVRSSAGADATQAVSVTVGVSVTNGVARVTSIRASCPGCTGSGSVSPGLVNVGSVMLGDVSCRATVSGTIPPG